MGLPLQRFGVIFPEPIGQVKRTGIDPNRCRRLDF